HFEQINDYPYQYDHMHNEQTFHQNKPTYQYTSNPTPFEYFEKPRQPLHWPQEIQQDTNLNQQSHPFQWHQSNLNQQSQPFAWHQEMQQYPDYYPQPQTSNRPPGILSQFQDENGQVDVNKMLATVSQLANTVQQVTPMIKQFSDFIKTFR